MPWAVGIQHGPIPAPLPARLPVPEPFPPQGHQSEGASGTRPAPGVKRLKNRTEGPVAPGDRDSGTPNPGPTGPHRPSEHGGPGKRSEGSLGAQGVSQRAPGSCPWVRPLVPFSGHAAPGAVSAPLPAVTPPGPRSGTPPPHTPAASRIRKGSNSNTGRPGSRRRCPGGGFIPPAAAAPATSASAARLTAAAEGRRQPIGEALAQLCLRLTADVTYQKAILRPPPLPAALIDSILNLSARRMQEAAMLPPSVTTVTNTTAVHSTATPRSVNGSDRHAPQPIRAQARPATPSTPSWIPSD